MILNENAYSHIKIISDISDDKQYTSIFELNNIGDSIPTLGFSDRRLFEDRIYKIPFKHPGDEFIDYLFKNISLWVEKTK